LLLTKADASVLTQIDYEFRLHTGNTDSKSDGDASIIEFRVYQTRLQVLFSGICLQ